MTEKPDDFAGRAVGGGGAARPGTRSVKMRRSPAGFDASSARGGLNHDLRLLGRIGPGTPASKYCDVIWTVRRIPGKGRLTAAHGDHPRLPAPLNAHDVQACGG